MAKHLVQQDTRLSQSALWDIQRNYFNHKGVTAWNNEIPFFISSNAFIATRYAHLVLQNILDNLVEGKTYYIVEVGSGPGKFSFYFLKAFEKSLAEQGLDIKYKYIITDVALKNIDFCASNEKLKPLIEEGKLDFALFDAAKDSDFELKKEGVSFSKCVEGNAAVFICNYVFDVIEQDLFEFRNDKLSEMRLSLHSRYQKFNYEQPSNLRELSLSYAPHEIKTQQYYENPELNELLFKYKDFFGDKKRGIFLLPLGAIDFIDRMKKISDNFLIICGDLGNVTLDEIKNVSISNSWTYEGCYCFLNNFHALGEYVKSIGGDTLLTKNRNSYKMCLYSVGKQMSELPKTRGYFEGEIEELGADEFCYLNEDFSVNNYRFTIKSCIGFLRLSCYEPDTYFHLHDKLIDNIEVMPAGMARDVIDALQKVEENLYHYQGFYDVFSLLGSYYLKVKKFAKAEQLFKQALNYGKNPFVPLRSLGMLYDERGNSNQAIKYYKKALQHKKRDSLCRNRISALQGGPGQIIRPLMKAAFVTAVAGGLLYVALFK